MHRRDVISRKVGNYPKTDSYGYRMSDVVLIISGLSGKIMENNRNGT